MNASAFAGGTQGSQLVQMSDFIDLISDIGNLKFSETLLTTLDQMIGASHCAAYRLSDYRLTEFASAGNIGKDLEFEKRKNVHEVKRHLMTAGDRVQVRYIHPTSSQVGVSGGTGDNHVTVLVYGRIKDASYCLRVLRPSTGNDASKNEGEVLKHEARLLLTIISRHAELVDQQADLTPAFTSREEIETCLENMSSLSRREREVCSRIMHGMSSCLIADDLGIGRESVLTYRKRAYTRVGVASQRELLMWYLGIWNGWVSSGNWCQSARFA